jgi:hypothetical protein
MGKDAHATGKRWRVTAVWLPRGLRERSPCVADCLLSSHMDFLQKVHV